LHRDPYFNVLAQCAGFKYARVYAASQTEYLYPLGETPSHTIPFAWCASFLKDFFPGEFLVTPHSVSAFDRDAFQLTDERRLASP